MKKVKIINAYGDKNIGDAAILKVAIAFIKEVIQIKNQNMTHKNQIINQIKLNI